MKKRYLVLIGLLAYFVALVVLMPAAQLLRWVDTSPVRLQGVSGTLWHGRAARLDLDELSLTDVGWRFLPRRVFLGELAAAVELRYLGGPGSAQVALDWRRALRLSALDYRLDARRLVDVMPLPLAEFDGDIIANLGSAIIAGGTLSSLDGKIRWQGAALSAPFEALLGDYRIDLTSTENDHRATLQGSGGTLDAEGELRLQRDGRYSADVTLRPRADAPPDLVRQIGFVARKQRNGSYLLRRSGQLSDFGL